MTTELTFNEEDHEYFLGKEKLPCVSDILAPLDDWSMIPASVLENKRIFGTNVHLMVKYYLEGDLDEDDLSDDLRGCLNAFKKWRDTEKWSLDHAKIEVPQYHLKFKYAGTPDIDEIVRGVVDIKTRLPDMLKDPLQLTAYKNFDRPDRPGYILSLFPDGTYVFEKMPEKQSWNIFRKMLKHHKDVKEFAEFLRKLKNQK